LGYEIWEATKNGYTAPSTFITNAAAKKAYKNNSKAKKCYHVWIDRQRASKSDELRINKKKWDKLKSIHEGDMKINEAKLQTHRVQFESLKMKT